MFVRRKRIRGNLYFQLVQSRRDAHGRVRQRVVASLGREPDILEASRAADRKARFLRRRARFEREFRPGAPSIARRLEERAKRQERKRERLFEAFVRRELELDAARSRALEAAYR